MYPFTDHFLLRDKNVETLKATMMGPNAMRVSEELVSRLDIDENTRILDLGCGRGLSTLFLVQKYGAPVIAADLWISPTENYERFRSLGIDNKAIPLSVDASVGLPFANEYFDLLLSVDAYHYFGDSEEMLPSLMTLVKKGGYIAIAIPGLKFEFGDNVPDEMKPFWNDDVARTIRSFAWWKELWTRTVGIEIVSIREMDCCEQAWAEWLTSPEPYAVHDVKMMEAEGGKYFNFIELIAKVI